jgi:TetR/AcrR family transcriptional regulator
LTIAERKQREKVQRREDILDAAEKLFFSRGFDNVLMDEIANEVELNRATLYLYFKDKESLFFAVVNRGIKIFRAMIEEEVKSAQANGLKVGGITMANGKFIREYPDYIRAYIYFRSGRFDLSNDEDLSSDAKEIIEFTEELYEKYFTSFKNGIEDGIYRPDVNPVAIVALNTFINDGISNLNPFLKKFIETHGITIQQLHMEIGDLVLHMLMNTGEKSENFYSSLMKWSSDILATEMDKDLLKRYVEPKEK